MHYEAVIGLKVHAQLQTSTKIFCGCETAFGEEANTRTCPVCIGMPGVLPVAEQKAVEYIIKTVLQRIARSPVQPFRAEELFLPGLPKGYQISQYELPSAREVCRDPGRREGQAHRHHPDPSREDAGKNLHTLRAARAWWTLNRAGTPPHGDRIRARISGLPTRLLNTSRSSVPSPLHRSLGRGHWRRGTSGATVIVSIRPVGAGKYGTRAEVKNVNSFKFVQKALEYEIKRQARFSTKAAEWFRRRGFSIPAKASPSP